MKRMLKRITRKLKRNKHNTEEDAFLAFLHIDAKSMYIDGKEKVGNKNFTVLRDKQNKRGR